MSRIEYQHYIGTGPEAEALIKDVQDRYAAFLAAVKVFEERHGFPGSWTQSSFSGVFVCGPTFPETLSDGRMSDLGLKYMGRVDGLHAYSPRLTTKAGKSLKAELAAVNALAIDRVRYLVKEAGMSHEIFADMTLARSTGGFRDGVVFIKVPTGNKDPQNGSMPTPPAWLQEVKESEFLAAQGR